MEKRKPEKQGGRKFKVGQTVKIKLNDGRLVDAIIRALVNDGEQKLQVDYGHEQTTLISLWQVVS
jgi:hypothetical protein